MPVPLHVLIVDDRIDDADLIARALRRGGYDAVCKRVETADALVEALAARTDWDVVLCDSVLPRLDIQRAVALLQRAGSSIPVLVVSGRYQSELQEALACATVSGFLSKDHLDELPALVRRLLSSRLQ